MDWNQLSGPQRKLLRQAILSAFPRSESFDMFLSDRLDKNSLDNMVGQGGFEAQLFRLLAESAAGGWTSDLVDALQHERSNNVLVRNLANAVRAAGAEPPGRLAAPDMAFEKIVQGGGFSDVRVWAEALARVSGATCRIESPANQAHGTGILVAADLVLTNFHVVQKLPVADGEVVCRFDYANDTSGLREGTPRRLVAGSGAKVADSPYDDKADVSGSGVASPSCLDYALLRLEKPIEDARPIPVSTDIALPGSDLPVLIVQHPKGTPQALAIGKSLGVNENGSRFRYDADTQEGSSGSGVFNQRLELIALHHAGDTSAAIRPPYNQGIPICLIAASFASKGIAKFWQ